ncbi:MAG: hypothetical protein J0M19_00030 [Sphingomonadales bacterium]|nr:hypothetical protein [Sphingomonadales bacterium]
MIERTLHCNPGQPDAKVLTQSDLQSQTGPVIVLGEAGMGKSHLLAWLGENPRHALCTARKLISWPVPQTLLGDAEVLVIDALDEVAAQRDGDALDRVLLRLGEAGHPPFILSCRVSDWRSATGREAIRGHYGAAPLELHLEPFTELDAATHLADHLGSARAAEVIDHYKARGLRDLLANPQTLDMIAKVARDEDLPGTKARLFERSIAILGSEHNDRKAAGQLGVRQVTNATGAAFAGLILTGRGAISRRAQANVDDEALPLAAVATLPDADMLDDVLGTRLFVARAADRFTYCHRRIAEFQAARWLARCADTPRKRRRLLSLFHRHGMVPASLRGLHAWLAQDAHLAEAVIRSDPMGVIEYGDADTLDGPAARALLNALVHLAAERPHFLGMGPYALRGLARAELRAELRTHIVSQNSPSGLRLILLEAVTGTAIAIDLLPELSALLHDPTLAYAIRSQSAAALLASGVVRDWPAEVRSLLTQDDESSARLALNLLHDLGDATFDDRTIAETAMAHLRRSRRTMSLLWHFEKRFPARRAEGVLEELLTLARASGRSWAHDREMTRLAYRLIASCLELGAVDPEKLWSWLSLFRHQLVGGEDAAGAILHHLKTCPNARRAIQRRVLLAATDEDTMWNQFWRLGDVSPGLYVSKEDVIHLLTAMHPPSPADTRWRVLMRAFDLQGEAGAAVREAARPFVAADPEAQAWLDTLVDPPVPQWQIESEARASREAAQRVAEWDEDRRHFLPQLESMRNGDVKLLLGPAYAYLRMFFDMGDDVPAHERVAQWLGPDIADAAHAGFEAFLVAEAGMPPACAFSKAHAGGTPLDEEWLLIVAAAERFRRDRGHDDLSDDRLLACLFAVRLKLVEDHVGLDGLTTSIEQAVRARGLWPTAMRTLYEPLLASGRTPVDGLHELMSSEQDAALASELAGEWLASFPTLPEHIETLLTNHLLHAVGGRPILQRLARERTTSGEPAREQRWDALGLIVDFEQTRARMDTDSIGPEVFWALRDRTYSSFRNEKKAGLDTAQCAWVIAAFRGAWPNAGYSVGGFVGDREPRHASEYLRALIQGLGNGIDPSAANALEALCDAPADSYSALIAEVATEQARKRMEAAYTPPTLEAVAAVVQDTPPACAADLQACVLDAIDTAAKMIRSDDVDSRRLFFEGDTPKSEDDCRNVFVGLLRLQAPDITFVPELHGADDKEIDIGCTLGDLLVPIEVKGQWHNELWTAADDQLDRLYTPDWRADDLGIYLVFWFGRDVPNNKRLKSPGQGHCAPDTPAALRDQLIARSRAAASGRVSVVVLDLTRAEADR